MFLWAIKQWLALKILVRYAISVLPLITSSKIYVAYSGLQASISRRDKISMWRSPPEVQSNSKYWIVLWRSDKKEIISWLSCWGQRTPKQLSETVQRLLQTKLHRLRCVISSFFQAYNLTSYCQTITFCFWQEYVQDAEKISTLCDPILAFEVRWEFERKIVLNECGYTWNITKFIHFFQWKIIKIFKILYI